MTRSVVDASVVVKWVVAEDGTPEALSLRSAGKLLAAPDLLIPECSNILWKKARRSELSEEEARLAARILQHTDIELHPMRDLMEPATRLAIRLEHAAYDCIYIALAEKYGWPFITADLRLVAKVRQSKLACRDVVISLEEAASTITGKQ